MISSRATAQLSSTTVCKASSACFQTSSEMDAAAPSGDRFEPVAPKMGGGVCRHLELALTVPGHRPFRRSAQWETVSQP